jgi:RNA polymerase sigma-70 factor (ECF subfamily)
MAENPTDAQLIQRIKERDTEAYELLFTRYRTQITVHIASIVRDDPLSQDLVQEVFLRIWTRAYQWDGRGKVKGWIYRIATNLSLNALRSRKRHPQQQLKIPPDEYSGDEGTSVPGWMIDFSAIKPEGIIQDTEVQHMLWDLINKLPPEKREVFQMVYDDEMDIQSVANALQIPEGTVKSRLYHSRKLLRQQIDENMLD